MEKTEPVIFKHQRKKLDTEIKIKLNRKRLYPSQSVRYLGIKIDQNLNWKDHINDIAVKLNRANALLVKITNFVNIILKTNLQHLILILIMQIWFGLRIQML